MRNEALDEFVEKVRAQSDILSVVSQYVSLKRKGNRYWGCCPFHQEKTPSFSITPDRGLFYCFGCHAGGNVFKFISLAENVTYFEAIKLQAEKLGISMPQRQKSPEELERDNKRKALYKLNEMARDFFHNCLTLTQLGAPGKAYLAGRDISEDVIKEFHLGFAPNAWDKLTEAFRKRGVDRAQLLEVGLALESKKDKERVYDRFRNRVMIPIADERGRVVAFGGRVLDGSLPKYLNTSETMIFNKGRLLFGLDRAHRAIQQEGFAIVVEGYMDAISVFGAGVRNVVASLGTSFTREQAKLLMRYARRICFCYDSDDAGQRATVRALSIVAELGAEVRVIVVPDGKDPDEFIRKHGREAFQSLVDKALPLVEYRLRYVLSHTRYDTLDGKVQALREILPVMSSLKDPAGIAEYRKRLAQILMLDEGVIGEEMARYVRMPELRFGGASVQTARKAQPKRDNAVRRAGRIVLRMLWQEPSLLAHVKANLPDGFPDGIQQEIMGYLENCIERGISADDISAAEVLSEDAAAELSQALVEETGVQDAEVIYEDSIRVLRKSYLNSLYMRYSREIEEHLTAGRIAEYQEALKAAKGVKTEMDGL
ncbi:MAG TPA: DNA primase [Selenomonas sp.]|nr:DNA primase [Selenomonadaceae bacterium]HCB92945.1 DNA primase [Selenomonas sp.]